MNNRCESDLSLSEQLALIDSGESLRKTLKAIPRKVELDRRTIDQKGRLDRRTVNIFRLIGGKMKFIYDFVDEACDMSVMTTKTARKYGVQPYTVSRARKDPNGFIDTFRTIVKEMKDRGIYE